MKNSGRFNLFLSLFFGTAAALVSSLAMAEGAGNLERAISNEFFLASPAVEFYQNGDFKNALEGFESLQREFPGDVLIQRYRAMALDRLDRFDEAADILKKIIAKDPGYVPARYFLGVVYSDSGKSAAAQTEWKWVVENAGNTIYKDWAKARLAAKAPEKKDTSARLWRLSARYGYEYDDNVTLKPSDEALASSEGSDAGRQLAEFIVRRRVHSSRDTAIDLKGGFRQTFHDSGLDDFNFTSLEAGADVQHRVTWFGRKVTLRLEYDLKAGFLDGNTFSTRNIGTLSADTRFTENTRTVLFYRLTGAEFGPDGSRPAQSSRDGIYQDVGLTQYWYLNNPKNYIFLRGELNGASTTGSNFDSLGTTARLGYHAGIFKNTDLDLMTGYEFNNYLHFDSLSSLDRGERQDSIWDIYGALTHYFTPEIGLRVFYRHVNADNDNGFFEYTRNIGGAQLLYSKAF